MPEPNKSAEFERLLLPHLDAAYNLARWLLRDGADAEDVVQEAYLRALKFFGGFRGGDARAWILKIVRNTAFTWLEKNRPPEAPASFDETRHGPVEEPMPIEADLVRKADATAIQAALNELPTQFREIVAMRDIEGLSYKEIADIADIPIGTVMSRLARARGRLARALAPQIGGKPN